MQSDFALVHFGDPREGLHLLHRAYHFSLQFRVFPTYSWQALLLSLGSFETFFKGEQRQQPLPQGVWRAVALIGEAQRRHVILRLPWQSVPLGRAAKTSSEYPLHFRQTNCFPAV